MSYRAAVWSAPALARLVAHLGDTGARALAAIDDEPLLAAWSETVEAFRDPRSPERTEIEPALVELSGLSPRGLAAGLEAVLGGVRGPLAAALLRRAGGMRREADGARRAPYGDARRDQESLATAWEGAVGTGIGGVGAAGGAGSISGGIAVAVLAGNLPALAVQPLLPALAMRRPLLLKSASAEPHFAPAFVRALVRRLPALAEGVAAVTWPGGDAALEAPVLAAAARVLAYGDGATVLSLQRRAPGEVVDYGPKLSFAVVSADADAASAARGLARDVALFDQRGCLSVQAVFVEGDALRARAVAAALALALGEAASALPPGSIDPATAAVVQQLRGEAELRGALVGGLPLASGTVLLEPPAAPLGLSPGLRTVRVYRLASMDELGARLARWRPLLQGAALAGERAWQLAPALAALGVSRCAAAGELQAADASWHNGGHDPLAVLA